MEQMGETVNYSVMFSTDVRQFVDTRLIFSFSPLVVKPVAAVVDEELYTFFQ
jgi:hypothetical protein